MKLWLKLWLAVITIIIVMIIIIVNINLINGSHHQMSQKSKHSECSLIQRFIHSKKGLLLSYC